MNFDQLIVYDLRNIFIEKPYAVCGAKTRPRPSSEKLKLSISLDHFIQFVYIVWQFKGYRNTLKLSCRLLVFNKNMSGTSLCALF